MNEDGNMNTTADTANKASELRPDIDLNDPKLGLKIAAERLSIVRYVFLVQIEDGIASAAQRASLEYADAVLIGWPETDSPEVVDLNDAQLKIVREHMELMEGYIGKYSQMEHDGDLDGMTDTLIRITERVAEVRRLYQPDFPLPTFAEIRRVVQDEWDEDMGKIDPKEDNPSAGEIEEETDELRTLSERLSADEKALKANQPQNGCVSSVRKNSGIRRARRNHCRHPRRNRTAHVRPVRTGRGQQPRQRQAFRTRQLAYTPARRYHGRHVRPDPQRPLGRRL